MLSMGTENRGADPTQKLPDYGDGSWTNPQIAADNRRYLADQEAQQAALHPVPPYQPPQPHAYQHNQPAPGGSYREPAYQPAQRRSFPASYRALPARKPALNLTRRFTCILLMPLALLTGLTSALAYWADTTLVDTQNFTELTSSLATDPDFQQALGTSVTDDIMSSDAIATYLGDGNSTTWYGDVQNWLYDRTHTIVSDATTGAITSENFQTLWLEVISDTHAYNFSGESRPAVLDLSAIYDQADDSVNNSLGFTIDTSTLPGRTVPLDNGQGSYPINSAINTLIRFSDSWQLLLAAAAVIAALSFLLWPGNRFAHLAFASLSAAALLWLAGLVGGGLSLTSGISLPASPTAVLFLQSIAEKLTASYADLHYRLAGYALIATLALTLMAILSAILRATARATTAHTR
ncbi:hypothetical protein GCM10023352_05660 [Rothia endophytica]|uniref:Uncharacterized protein n=2 Tax=Rothia endophytica TaxID=1324766 RepID=A0ABP9B8A9_9MICC